MMLVRSLALLCSLSTVAAFVAPGRHTSLQRSIINNDISSTIGSTELYSHKLVLVRHGESEWNDLNIFTGWADAALNEKGVAEAIQGGKYLKEAGFTFDVAYTSVLKRAIKTLWLVLEEMDLMYIPIVSSCVVLSSCVLNPHSHCWRYQIPISILMFLDTTTYHNSDQHLASQ